MVSCPPASDSEAMIAIRTTGPRLGTSRSEKIRARRKRVLSAWVLILASAALTLAVVLAILLVPLPANAPATVRSSPPAATPSVDAAFAGPTLAEESAVESIADSDRGAETEETELLVLSDDKGSNTELDSRGTTRPDAERDEAPSFADAPTSAPKPGELDSMSPGGGPEDYPDSMPSAGDDDESPTLSRAEKQQLAKIERLKKGIRRHFIAQRRTASGARGRPDDHFVVAKYEMPFATRVADVRFEVTADIDASVEQVADYLVATPAKTRRDYQVVARFGSISEAEEGVQAIRQRYDQAREYQAQLLTYLQYEQAQQRFQARSMRRC